MTAFLSLSFGEMLIVGLVALLIFGGRLPEVMRNLGRAYARFRHGVHDASRPFRDEIRQLDLPRRPDALPPLPRAEPPPAPPYAPEEPPAAPADPGTAAPGTGGGAADEPPPV